MASSLTFTATSLAKSLACEASLPKGLPASRIHADLYVSARAASIFMLMRANFIMMPCWSPIGLPN